MKMAHKHKGVCLLREAKFVYQAVEFDEASCFSMGQNFRRWVCTRCIWFKSILDFHRCWSMMGASLAAPTAGWRSPPVPKGTARQEHNASERNSRKRRREEGGASADGDRGLNGMWGGSGSVFEAGLQQPAEDPFLDRGFGVQYDNSSGHGSCCGGVRLHD